LIWIIGQLTAAFAALGLALSVNPIFLAIAAIGALAAGITALVVIMNKQKKAQEDANRTLDDQKKKIEETTKAMEKFGKAYEDLTLAQKIARTETLIANQELAIQEATAKKNEKGLLILNLSLKRLKISLKELNDQLQGETNKSLQEIADVIKENVIKELSDLDREYQIFGDEIDLNAEKQKIFKDALLEALEKGLDPQKFTIGYLRGEYEKLIEVTKNAAAAQEKMSEAIEFVAAKREKWAEALQIYRDAYKVLNRLRMDDMGREIAAINDMEERFIEAGINRIEVEEWAQKEIDKIREVYAQKEEDRQRDLALENLATMQDLFSRLSGIVSQFAQFEETTLENEYENRRQHIEDTIENEQDKENALMELDKEMEARRKGMEQDQARRSKVISIFESLINTAVAVTKVLANPILAGIVAGLGAFQTALIAATPIPQFATGADFVVPPGYPNDSYLMAAQSGEHVSITSKEKSKRVVVLDMHDNTFNGPGGVRDFARILKDEFDSLDVLGL